MLNTSKDPYAKSSRAMAKWKKDFKAGKTVCYNYIAADEFLGRDKEYDLLIVDDLGNKTYINTPPVIWP